MKSRTLIIGLSIAVCGVSVAGMLYQSRQLDGLRDEERRLRLELEHLQAEKTERVGRPPVVARATATPSLELLRLRNQVSMLMRRQRELAAAPAENQRLHARIESAPTNTTIQLPAGYIRTSQARYVGYNTPADTLQSLLWAVQNRDFTNMLAAFTPEVARQMQAVLDRLGEEQFFKDASALPGMRIVGREQMRDGAVELQVEIAPGIPSPERMRLRQINGEWKLETH